MRTIDQLPDNNNVGSIYAGVIIILCGQEMHKASLCGISKDNLEVNMEYGYVRVSTKEQNELRQMIALREFGVDEKYVYMDKQSGKDFERPNYKKLIRRIKKDDTLVIKSIDRLGRNYEEILEQWRIITKEKKASIVVLDMPLLDTQRSNENSQTGCVLMEESVLLWAASTGFMNLPYRSEWRRGSGRRMCR